MGDVVSIKAVRKKKVKAHKHEKWEIRFSRTSWGSVKPTLGNALLVLTESTTWAGALVFDAFAGRVRITKPTPAEPALEEPQWWTDEMGDRVRVDLETKYDMALARETMAHAIRLAAEQNTVHPLQAYLSALVWDKKKRIDTWLVDHIRVKDEPHVRAMGAAWMISAVARAFEPGCQVDYVLILEGGQRAGKSTVIRALMPDLAWYLETSVELGNKDAYHVIRNKWIVELAELDSVARGDASKIKAFITSKIDTYCPRYGREAIDQPRGCVFIGSTNEQEYLKDETGGGRWWPVWSAATIEDPLRPDDVAAIRDQLWAEAVFRYKSAEPWHITDEKMLAKIASVQDERRQADPWEGPISAYLDNRKRHTRGISVAEIVLNVLKKDEKEVDKALSMRIARTLTALHWQRAETATIGNRRVKLYRPNLKAEKPQKKVVQVEQGGTDEDSEK